MDIAIAFVAGGIFTAAVNVIATEIAAHRAEGRITRRSLREVRLDALRKTSAWVAAYTAYALAVWVDSGREWDRDKHSEARPGLVGEEAALVDYYACLNTLFRCDRETNPPFVEDIEALNAAAERVQQLLAEQTDRVAAGGDPLVIPEVRVADITSESSLIAGWWEGFGLEHRPPGRPNS